MKSSVPISASLILLGMAFGASAQTMKPGLWEIGNKMQSASGEMEKGMADLQQQMATMPPEQRKMMQDMMGKQGVSISAAPGGGMAIKVCLTPEMVARNEMPTQQGDCKSTQSPRSGNTMKMSFVCTKPPSSGEGQITFVSADAYTSQMTVNTTVGGKPEQMKMDSGGKWLGSDCGSVKPLAVPKK